MARTDVEKIAVGSTIFAKDCDVAYSVPAQGDESG